jgi:hypothetical protein
VKRGIAAPVAPPGAGAHGFEVANGGGDLLVDAPPTEFDFILPRGFVDGEGRTHRTGSMRVATARDELLPLMDARVRENQAYLTVVLLGRVVTRIGDLPTVNDTVIENMFASDVAFLQDLYRRVNTEGHTTAAVHCPSCEHEFTVDLAGGRLGES